MSHDKILIIIQIIVFFITVIDLLTFHQRVFNKILIRRHLLITPKGIIGWRLPVAAITGEGVPLAAKNMQKDSILSAAIGITTTDRYPKVRYLKCKKKRFSSFLSQHTCTTLILTHRCTPLFFVLKNNLYVDDVDILGQIVQIIDCWQMLVSCGRCQGSRNDR